MSKLNKGMFSSNNQKWETPQDLFDKLNDVFNFEVDIAADDETAKCPIYYTEENDGLKKEWKEVCWCNPPYGRYQIEWVKRANEQVKKYMEIALHNMNLRMQDEASEEKVLKRLFSKKN